MFRRCALLEVLGKKHLDTGHAIIDAFGSRDNEGLALARILGKDQIFFVTGNSVNARGRWNARSLKKLSLKEIEKYEVALSVSAFYGDMEEELHGLSEIVYKHIYKRTHWKKLYYLTIREASNFIFARIKLPSSNLSIAKAEFIHLLREARHMGCAIGVHTIRWTSIDKELGMSLTIFSLRGLGLLGCRKISCSSTSM